MTIRTLLPAALLMTIAAGSMAVPAQAGSGVPGSILPQPSISPGLSQTCVHALDPKVRGAAANRAARACRRPTGPQSPVRTATATAKGKPSAAVTSPAP